MTDTTTYEGIDADVGLLMATVVAWMLAIVGAIPIVRSLDTEADSALFSFALVLGVVLFLGTAALPIRRFNASISDLEFRFSRRSTVSWMIGRAPESSVVPVREIQWIRVDWNPLGDGAIVIQGAASRFRIPIGRSARAVAFSDALKRLATSGSGSQIEVRPDWWSTSSGQTSSLAIALLSLATAISVVFIDMDSKLRANVVVGGLVLCGFALYSLYTSRKS